MALKSILVAGHYCHDTLFLADGTCHRALGGSVSYISSVLSSLGLDYRVVSKVGPDFEYFSKVSVGPQAAPLGMTTSFLADFSTGERSGKVCAVCEPIFPSDIPAESYEIAMAVGIVGEVLPETLDCLARRSRILLCDVQGMIRWISSDGRVGFQRLEETPYFSRLNKIAFLKASRVEAQWIDLDKARTLTRILVTEGKQGCTIYGPDWELSVPPFAVTEVDPTGAGDCFLAGFTAGLMKGLPIQEAALLGNYFGALAVQQVGVPNLPSDDRLVFAY